MEGDFRCAGGGISLNSKGNISHCESVVRRLPARWHNAGMRNHAVGIVHLGCHQKGQGSAGVNLDSRLIRIEVHHFEICRVEIQE